MLTSSHTFRRRSEDRPGTPWDLDALVLGNAVPWIGRVQENDRPRSLQTLGLKESIVRDLQLSGVRSLKELCSLTVRDAVETRWLDRETIQEIRTQADLWLSSTFGVLRIQSSQVSKDTDGQMEPQLPVIEKVISHSIDRSLKTLSAWGAAELGARDLLEVFDLSSKVSDRPPEVEDALSRLSSVGLKQLAGDEYTNYDVGAAIGSLLGIKAQGTTTNSSPMQERTRKEILDERELYIAAARTLAIRSPETLEELGTRFDVSRERIRQLENQAIEKMNNALIQASYRVIRRVSHRLRSEIGTAILSAQFSTSVRESINFQPTEAAVDDIGVRLLLWIAGPYEQTDEWLVVAPDQYTQRNDTREASGTRGVRTSTCVRCDSTTGDHWDSRGFPEALDRVCRRIPFHFRQTGEMVGLFWRQSRGHSFTYWASTSKRSDCRVSR